MDDSQQFWYLRVCHITGGDIKWREGDWKSAHKTILQCVSLGFASHLSTSSTLVTSILLEAGYNPRSANNRAIIDACQGGLTEIVKLLLEDGRADPSIQDNYPIAVACNWNTDLVALLLADPRVDPSDNDNRAIKIAASWGSIETVKLLIGDRRVNVRAEGDCALHRARYLERADVVELLETHIR